MTIYLFWTIQSELIFVHHRMQNNQYHIWYLPEVFYHVKLRNYFAQSLQNSQPFDSGDKCKLVLIAHMFNILCTNATWKKNPCLTETTRLINVSCYQFYGMSIHTISILVMRSLWPFLTKIFQLKNFRFHVLQDRILCIRCINTYIHTYTILKTALMLDNNSWI